MTSMMIVHSAGLNPVGYKLMALTVWPVFKLPSIPELDFSGTVVDGNGTEFQAGQGESVVYVGIYTGSGMILTIDCLGL